MSEKSKYRIREQKRLRRIREEERRRREKEKKRREREKIEKKQFHMSFQEFWEELTKLENDPVYKAWISEELARLKVEVENQQKQLKSRVPYNPSNTSRQLESLSQQLQQMLEDADKHQENEVVRAEIIKVVMEVMKEEGFTLSTPKLETDRLGNVIVLGKKPGKLRQQEVQLALSLDGNMSMDVDSGESGDIARIQEAQLDKTLENKVACHQIGTQLQNAIVKKGVPLEEKKVNWHNPDRIAKGSKELPGGQSRHHS